VVGGRRREADLDLLPGASLATAAALFAVSLVLVASGVLPVQAINAIELRPTRPVVTSNRAERADMVSSKVLVCRAC
jgi:hypothetical protein